MTTDNELAVIRGHQELYERTWHLFQAAKFEISCAANDLYTWVTMRPSGTEGPPMADDRPHGFLIRKLYRPGVLLDPVATQHVRQASQYGAQVRITPDEINETIIIDRRVAELMSALGASSRFQAGVRARELGLV